MVFAMKNILLFLLLFLLGGNINAQRQCIVLFDCTGSMKENNCWETAKSKLKDIAINVCDKETEIVIIPFQENLKPIIRHNQSYIVSHWGEIVNELDKHINSKHRGTCIVKALESGGNCITPACFNSLHLITDGTEDKCGHSENDLVEKIRTWCNKYGMNCQNFYVPLSDDAMPESFRNAINSYCFSVVPPTTYGNFYEQEININTEEIESGVYRKLTFTRNDTWTIETESKDPFFDVFIADNQVKNGKAKFCVKIKNGTTPEELKKILLKQGKMQNDVYSFCVHFNADSIYFGSKDFCIINVTFKIQKVLSFSNDIDVIDFGESYYYPRFLFWPCHNPDELECTITAAYNSEAIQKKSSIKLKMICDDDQSQNIKYSLSCNGKECTDDEFEIVAGENDSYKLKIVFAPETSEGKKHFHFEVVPGTNNYDKITGHTEFEVPESYMIPVKAIYSVCMNPLLKMLIWFVFIVFVGVLLRALYMFLSPKMKGNISIVYTGIPGGIPYSIQGCTKFVFTDIPFKQSLLKKLIFGKVGCPNGRRAHPFWSSPLIIKRKDSRSIKILCNQNYLINNVQRNIPQICKQGRTRIIITNIINNDSVTLIY